MRLLFLLVMRLTAMDVESARRSRGQLITFAFVTVRTQVTDAKRKMR